MRDCSAPRGTRLLDTSGLRRGRSWPGAGRRASSAGGVPPDARRATAMPPLTLLRRERPGVTVIVVSGELDATNRGQFESFLRERPEPGHVVFDLARVPFVDSSGLHVLLAFATDQLGRSGAVRLAAVQPLPARLLDITGVLAHVPVHDTVEEAVAAARAAAERSG
ncbi:STAS domain-containing protein [Nonomuraea sp. NPDC051191]|uniref:STAS domain-containing protein n=1 Tax=Nonomuraea sp. NPDC051191 TaxID=3364372 RepID=UPI00378E556A